MQVEIIENGILICPETDFEKDYLMQFEHIEGFAKYGVSRNKDYFVGLKIQNKKA